MEVPHYAQWRDLVLDQLREYIAQGVTLLLPMATILETGNHIAQNGDGHQRRETAERFIEQVRQAIEGRIPLAVPQPLLDPDVLNGYLDQFPDFAMREIGLGDLTIVKEFEKQCELNPVRHVFIWSLDHHLAGYVQEPPQWAV